MNIEPLKRLAENADLFALPTDPDQLTYVAKLAFGIRGVDYAATKAPATADQRIHLWKVLNENMAQIQAEDALVGNEADPIEAALAKALGRQPSAPQSTTITNADVSIARHSATVAIKKACAAVLVAGYRP
ncbi:hypothetical protein [Devosia elaeis]|uniref:Uncharacterized protein n=1 Tax=Devosia elaeis TaxID=1770058 RepID=A0A178I0E9_9HYPH|nr:hypothetical protein [Devosia elaeis]OAM77766.1 hypothetical protein A3840_08455 [Devosia elaeis]